MQDNSYGRRCQKTSRNGRQQLWQTMLENLKVCKTIVMVECARKPHGMADNSYGRQCQKTPRYVRQQLWQTILENLKEWQTIVMVDDARKPQGMEDNSYGRICQKTSWNGRQQLWQTMLENLWVCNTVKVNNHYGRQSLWQTIVMVDNARNPQNNSYQSMLSLHHCLVCSMSGIQNLCDPRRQADRRRPSRRKSDIRIRCIGSVRQSVN